MAERGKSEYSQSVSNALRLLGCFVEREERGISGAVQGNLGFQNRQWLVYCSLLSAESSFEKRRNGEVQARGSAFCYTVRWSGSGASFHVCLHRRFLNWRGIPSYGPPGRSCRQGADDSKQRCPRLVCLYVLESGRNFTNARLCDRQSVFWPDSGQSSAQSFLKNAISKRYTDSTITDKAALESELISPRVRVICAG